MIFIFPLSYLRVGPLFGYPLSISLRDRLVIKNLGSGCSLIKMRFQVRLIRSYRMRIIGFSSLNIFEKSIQLLSKVINYFIFVFYKDLTLIRRDINIIIIIFHLNVKNEDRVHTRIILFVHVSKKLFEFTRHVDWSFIKKEEYLLFVNFRTIHTSTQDSFCNIAINLTFGNFGFEFNKLLKFRFSYHL